jgi:signal transduction histidine kinase
LGLGLIGMRERLEALGGEMVIRSVPGQGTVMTATIPLER